MTIPGAEHAQVEDAKVRDYLLSHEHPVGRFKAAFFTSLGYSRESWRLLQQDLQVMAHSDDARAGQASAFGQKFEVSATLRGPSGREALVVTVWILLKDEGFPRLVTAYPGESR